MHMNNIGLKMSQMKVLAMSAMASVFGVAKSKKEAYSGVGNAFHYSQRSPGSAANKRRRKDRQIGAHK